MSDNTVPKTFLNVRVELWVCLLLILCTLLVYHQAAGFDFQNYDTATYVYQNRHVKAGLSMAGVRWAFTAVHASNWHPLTWLSHMLDVELYGLVPGRHHLTNVLLHVVNGLLLFLILRRMTGKLWQSSLVAAMFALHPIHIQSVAWVAERKDLLSAFFGFWSIGAYLHYVRHSGIIRYLMVLVLFSLSLLSKPMLVTLPFVLLLLDYWPLHRFKLPGAKRHPASESQLSFRPILIIEKIPLLMASAGSCAVTVFAQQTGGAVTTLEAFPLTVRIANALVSYLGYIGKMIWPSKLAILYPHPGMPPLWQPVVCGIVLLIASYAAVRLIKSRPWFFVGWFWYLGTLVPVIGLVQVGGQAMADRYAYIPFIGLYILVAWWLEALVARWPSAKLLKVLPHLLIMGALMLVTSHELKFWQNSGTLFKRALEVTRGNYVAHNSLGVYLADHGREDDAIAQFNKVLEINPGSHRSHYNVGLALVAKEKFEQAIPHFKRALELNPDSAASRVKLGYAFYRLGQLEQAAENYKLALQIDSENAEAYNYLGLIMVRRRNIKKALAFFRQALRADPDYAEARHNMDKTQATFDIKGD